MILVLTLALFSNSIEAQAGIGEDFDDLTSVRAPIRMGGVGAGDSVAVGDGEAVPIGDAPPRDDDGVAVCLRHKVPTRLRHQPGPVGWPSHRLALG